MLRRIQRIEGIGSYTNAGAGRIQFEKVNVIYGENRNGKSTLCDILYSLSTNNPELIKDRKTIAPVGQAVRPMKVQLQFDEGPIFFGNEQWERIPQGSQLYIFDHSFIHRNVMSGIVSNRDNSENVSSFILGEQGTALLEQLKQENEDLKQLRKDFKASEKALIDLGVTGVATYAASQMPTDSTQELDEQIEDSKQIVESLAVQISNIDTLRAKAELSCSQSRVDISGDIQQINECLVSCIEEVHEDAKAIVESHLQKIKNAGSFKGWASNGLNHLGENCPFCGQELSKEASQLIDSYKTAFDEAFATFNRDTKLTATRLLTKRLAEFELDALSTTHSQNIEKANAYSDLKISLKDLLEELESDYEEIIRAHEELAAINSETLEQLREVLQAKMDTPYIGIQALNFNALNEKVTSYLSSELEYKSTVEKINAAIQAYKVSLDATALNQQKTNEIAKQASLETKKKRIAYEPQCQTYRQLKDQLENDEATYANNKQQLEESQEQFLDEYFELINQLFGSVGSRKFQISRKINRSGTKTVYDLEVSFNGTVIHKNKINSLFSESDRRALALCIFLAKILKLSDEDKQKAILVMDDPVTSFDSERISSILKKLYEIVPVIRQLFITTHYRGMAASTLKKFQDTAAMKIVKLADTSDFEQTSEVEMAATEHDDTFNDILELINYQTQEKRIHLLRPFLENELRTRFKSQLKDLGLTNRSDFSECINQLRDNAHIGGSVATELHSFRTELNTPMHELQQRPIEDIRSFATDMMDFIYSRLK